MGYDTSAAIVKWQDITAWRRAADMDSVRLQQSQALAAEGPVSFPYREAVHRCLGQLFHSFSLAVFTPSSSKPMAFGAFFNPFSPKILYSARFVLEEADLHEPLRFPLYNWQPHLDLACRHYERGGPAVFGRDLSLEQGHL